MKAVPFTPGPHAARLIPFVAGVLAELSGVDALTCSRATRDSLWDRGRRRLGAYLRRARAEIVAAGVPASRLTATDEELVGYLLASYRTLADAAEAVLRASEPDPGAITPPKGWTP